MRKAALAYILIALVALVPSPAVAGDDVVFAGSGWGHGVGMTQYGAYGMALQGSTASQILHHYYPTTSLGTISAASVKPFLLEEAMPLWVGIMQDELTVTFRPQGDAATLCLESGTQTCPTAAQPGELWRFEVLEDGSGCVFARNDGGGWVAQTEKASTCRGSVTPNSGSGSIELVYLGNRYANGVLRLRPGVTIEGVHAIWQTAIEPYVRGITEIPDSWSPAALEAQAIAARSYALARAGWRGSAWEFNDDRKDACYCNLFATNWDQVWTGASGAASNPNFAAAAANTAGTIVIQGVGEDAGRVAEAVYSSSSGGVTERNADYWGGPQLPYLVNVSDAAAHIPEAGNPHSVWSKTVANSTVANALGFDTITDVTVTQRYPSGSAKTVRFSGTKNGSGVATDVSGNWTRITFGLRSQYYSTSADGTAPPPSQGTLPMTDGTTPYNTSTTTSTTTTTTTLPPTTTTVAETTTTSTEASTTTTSTTTSTTTTVPETTTTVAPTTTVEVVEVAPPSDPGVNDPAPVTNREEEAPGEGEDVPPPPVPVDEGNPIPTIPWEDRLDGEQATPGFVWVEVDDLSTTTSGPTTMPPTTAAPLTEPAEAPPGAVGDDPSTIVEIPLVLADGDMPELSSEPTPWRRTVFDTATSLGDWIAGVAAWMSGLVSP